MKLFKPFIIKLTMTSVIVITKGGDIKESKIKEINRDQLYKKAGFKSPDNFIKQTSWNVSVNNKNVCIELWAREYGKATTENKYDFPPPVDTKLFFGSCILLNCHPHSKIPCDLSADLWKTIYNKLFDGFDDINDNDSIPSEDELEGIPKIFKSKDGYLKDGFIVDDEGDEDDEDDTDDELDITDYDDNDVINNELNNEIINKLDNESDLELLTSDNDLIEDDYSYSSEDNSSEDKSSEE